MATKRRAINVPGSEKLAEDELLKRGIILLYGRVNEELYYSVAQKLTYLQSAGSPDFELHIDSVGGNVEYGFMIYDRIRNYSGNVTGVVAGQANSMASVILQACRIRKMSMHAVMFIHNVIATEISLDVLRDEKRLRARIASLEDLNAQMVNAYASQNHHNRKRIIAQMNKNQRTKADEALLLGLIDEII